jgi:hypothetical protein
VLGSGKADPSSGGALAEENISYRNIRKFAQAGKTFKESNTKNAAKEIGGRVLCVEELSQTILIPTL